jgi:predicted Zn-dependent protease
LPQPNARKGSRRSLSWFNNSGADKAQQDPYVAAVGRSTARSGLRNSERDFTVSLLTSPVNNPSPSRAGTLIASLSFASTNDEAEPTAVLGHEIGHFAKRDSRARTWTSTVSSVPAGLLGAVTRHLSIGRIAGQLYRFRFSRQQQLETRDLGVCYHLDAGRDPLTMSAVLASLADQNALDQRTSGDAPLISRSASTHPDPASRVVRAAQRAQATAGAGGERNRGAFLATIDGMLYATIRSRP